MWTRSGVRQRRLLTALCVLAGSVLLAQSRAPQTTAERGPQPVSPAELQAAVNQLGNLDFGIRMNAARTVRRAPAGQAVPALVQAVSEHQDGYVRFRALVLLTGFNDPRTTDTMRQAVNDPNDRLRTVAYAFFEHNPEPGMVPQLLRSLQREEAEFVRPALVRALAAQGGDPRVRDTLLVEVGRGQDFFRSAVIEALGDYRATYALEALIRIARLDGPLQNDAAIALGRLGNRRAMEVLSGLQRTAPRESQPPVAAAICLLGINCQSHLSYLIDTLRFADKNPGFQGLLRSTVAGLSAIASTGNEEALTALFDVGIPSQNPPRAPMALGVGTLAIRNTPLTLTLLEKYPDREGAIDLIGEGFDMLEEDYEEERFFATVRGMYWQAAEDSATRKVGGALIQKLEF